MKTQLSVVVHNEDGAACHFAACAAGGQHGNQGRYALCNEIRTALDGGVVGERTGVSRRNRHAFSTVDGPEPPPTAIKPSQLLAV